MNSRFVLDPPFNWLPPRDHDDWEQIVTIAARFVARSWLPDSGMAAGDEAWDQLARELEAAGVQARTPRLGQRRPAIQLSGSSERAVPGEEKPTPVQSAVWREVLREVLEDPRKAVCFLVHHEPELAVRMFAEAAARVEAPTGPRAGDDEAVDADRVGRLLGDMRPCWAEAYRAWVYCREHGPAGVGYREQFEWLMDLQDGPDFNLPRRWTTWADYVRRALRQIEGPRQARRAAAAERRGATVRRRELD